jgi:hypothetical protein
LRINAWQRQGQVDLVSSAGHHVQFSDQRVFPRPFVMRHYPILSEAHAREKYENRDFAPDELARKWHSDRAAFKADGVRLPSRAQLHEVEPDMAPDPTEPWDRHPFLDLAAGPAPTRVAVDPDRPARLRALVDYATRHRAHVVEIPPATGDGPRWSVMLPVRDPRPAHLTAALRSVLDQDPGGNRMDIEVIDDASAATDVASIVSSVGGDRVRYHRNPSRLGLAGNWNAAVTRARGQFVHLLHQDDRVVPGFYDRLGRALAADPSLVAAYCRVAGIDNDGRLTWVQPPERLEAGVMTDLAVKEAEAHRVLTAGVTVRRSTYEAIGGYRDDLPYCTDWDFLKRAAVLGPIWYEPLVLAHWRQHDDQETVRLQATGEDLVDRRRSIELTATLLPRELRPRVEARALDASIVAALERLRELVEADEIEAAIAQTREVLFTLETRRAEIPNRARNEWVPNLDGLGAQRQADADQRRIAELEAQLKGWVAAVRMARTHSADGER